MDVISSGLEACPWGLNGYGFDHYIAGSPGNAVMALARYWHDQAAEIAAIEEKHPDLCHRVLYEEMVRDPERVAAGLFDFIGVAQVPGITQAVFVGDHERFGPADHKIWHTSKISADSIGRSDSVPTGLIPPPVLESINGLLDRLGYVPIDETWGTGDRPAGLLASADGATIAEENRSVPKADVLADRLAAGFTRVDGAFAARWPERIGETFTAVIRQPNSPRPIVWRVNPAARALINDGQPVASAPGEPGDGGEDADWSMVGTVQAWLEVLAGRMNLSVALRRNELRYCDFGESDISVTEDRIALLANFLGLPYLSDNPAMPAGRSSPRLRTMSIGELSHRSAETAGNSSPPGRRLGITL